MNRKTALILGAIAGALLAASPASATPLGATALSGQVATSADRVVDQVHYRRWRHNHRHAYRNYGYRSYGYRPYYGYTSPYYGYNNYGYRRYGYGYGNHYRRPGISFGFTF